MTLESKEKALSRDITLFPWLAYPLDLYDFPTSSILAFIAYLNGILLDRMEDQP